MPEENKPTDHVNQLHKAISAYRRGIITEDELNAKALDLGYTVEDVDKIILRQQ